ncbi:hypothetical protein TH61_16380 [Rufibacter sp. DG15C]|uniref:hypothetical protein n=1 Tax=Rufibacter sp. DG15C TaxID=1379909 RepID=UPI00078B3979|nr:hypothetical protein [Rufibacter sp. DG15C]AMM52450.1 hypothetical protein TH61_16380 [Rufibacter sp. DG15C]
MNTMPRFDQDTVDTYLDDFLDTLKNKQRTERIVGGIYFGLLDDAFREEIANGMEDVKQLTIKAEEYIEARLSASGGLAQ